MKHSLTIVLAVMLSSVAALGVVPNFSIDVDTQEPTKQWEIPAVFAGASPLIRFNFYQDGVVWTPSSDWAGFFWYGNKADWSSASTVKIAATFSNAWTYADVQSTVTNFVTLGRTYGGFVMTNAAGQKIEWGRGQLTTLQSAGLGTTTPLTGNVLVNWDLIGSYAGTWPFTVSYSLSDTNSAIGTGSSGGYTITIHFGTNYLTAPPLTNTTTKTFTQNVYFAGAAGVVDSSGNQSINPANRKLYEADGTTLVVDWATQILYDALGAASVNWESRRLHNFAGQIVVDWENQQLNDESGGKALDWTAADRTLYDASENARLDWDEGILLTPGGSTHWTLPNTPTGGYDVVNWTAHTQGLYNATNSLAAWIIAQAYMQDLVDDTTPTLGGILNTVNQWLSPDGSAKGIRIENDGDVFTSRHLYPLNIYPARVVMGGDGASTTESSWYSSGQDAGGARYLDYLSGSATKSGGKHTFGVDGLDILIMTTNGIIATNAPLTIGESLNGNGKPATNLLITLPYQTGGGIVSTNFPAYSRVRIIGPRSYDIAVNLTHVQCEAGTQVVYFVEGPTNTPFGSLPTTNLTLTATTTGAQSASAYTVESTNQLLMVLSGTHNSAGITSRTDATVNGTFPWTL